MELAQKHLRPGERTRDDHPDLQGMRKDVYPSGERSALAGLLPGVQRESPAGAADHPKLPGLRAELHFPGGCKALAGLLHGVPGEAALTPRSSRETGRNK